jgi:phosphoglucomutase
MNAYTVARATAGLADTLLARGGRSVAISYDSRHGSAAFAMVTAGTLAACGLRACLFDRLMPTPVLSFATRALHADAGVMITASHNPAEYNGYTVYGADGCQITDAAAAEITAAIERRDYAGLVWLTEGEARAAGLLTDIPDSVVEAYLQKTLACRVHPDACAPITVCYTPLNGAGLIPVREALGSMRGVTVTVVEAQAAPDGDFPPAPSPTRSCCPRWRWPYARRRRPAPTW